MNSKPFNYSSIAQQKTIPKLRHEIVIKMANGDAFGGRIFIGFNERAIDVINDARPFIPVELENNQIIMVSKKNISMIDALERTSERSTRFNPKVYKSILFEKKNLSQEVENIQENAEHHIIDTQTDKMNEECQRLLAILNNQAFQEKRKHDREFNKNVEQIANYFSKKAFK